MFLFESIALAYFLAVAAAAPFTRVARRRRAIVAVAAIAMAVIVALVARSAADVWRTWLPHMYLVAGYWTPGLLTPRISEPTAFERWLVSSDARLRPRLPGLPPMLVHITEVAYLTCYPLVPASFTIVWLTGTAQDISRFWVAVLTAGYLSYASLPWLLSRPPRLLANAMAPATHVGAVNVFVLGRLSHQLNTFPSGHVAVSLAAAGVVAMVRPAAGAAVAVIALAIAVGAAAGRYHYVIDVVLGIVAAAAAIALTAAQ